MGSTGSMGVATAVQLPVDPDAVALQLLGLEASTQQAFRSADGLPSPRNAPQARPVKQAQSSITLILSGRKSGY